MGAAKRGYAPYLQLAGDLAKEISEEVQDSEKKNFESEILFSQPRDRCKLSLLHHAVEADCAACVRTIRSFAPELVAAQDVWRGVPLHRCRSEEVCKELLLEAGEKLKAMLSAQTRAPVKESVVEAGDTPLHAAVRRGLSGVVSQILTTSHSNKIINDIIDIANREGESALDVAASLQVLN